MEEGVKKDTAGEGTEDVVTLSLELVGVGHTPSTAFSPAPFVYLRATAHPRRGQRPQIGYSAVVTLRPKTEGCRHSAWSLGTSERPAIMIWRQYQPGVSEN